MKWRTLPLADDESQPVMVPRNDKALVAISPDRVRRLCEHIIQQLDDLREAKHLGRIASPTRPEPTGFLATVVQSACALCKGWCCRNGDDDGFLDDRTLARVRLAKPELAERALLRLYLDRVPAAAYRDSCIFHGKQGCTLSRSMRADVCNAYYCGGLSAYVEGSVTPRPTIVIAGEGDKIRTSPVLNP